MDYATVTNPVGHIVFGYPASYGNLDSIELGLSVMSQDISSEFTQVNTTRYGISYLMYIHNNVTDLTETSTYKLRFVIGVNTDV